MTMSEYDREVNRRVRRMWMRKHGWVIFNPVTMMIAAHVALAVVFALLGWEVR